jgi:hypothetical protein
MSECKWVLVNILLALENLVRPGMLRDDRRRYQFRASDN